MARNWFESGGGNYAKFRPTYPAELATYLADLATSDDVAIDVGCGNGQLTALLAEHFTSVLGQDPSAEQIKSAVRTPGVTYSVAPAEKIAAADGVADVITAAQAAHWFNLSAFFEEVRRVAKPGALLALISYGTPFTSEEKLTRRFDDFYWNEIGSYWPPERRLVDEGYRTIDFPFREIAQKPMAIEKDLTLDEFLGYISTWSAVKVVREANREDILTTFEESFAELWGDAAVTVRITWPINIRMGIVS